jgi:hypothetical protein
VTRIGPTIKAIVDRGRRAILLGQIGPRDARAKDVKNAVDHAAIINALHDLLGSTCLMNPHSKSLISDRAIFLPPHVPLAEMNHKPRRKNRN